MIMKNSGIEWIGEIPDDWDEIPNRYLFEEHSSKVGENAVNYQLLSLTTQGVKEKDINSTGGKVPSSYDNYQTVSVGDMVFCLFDLDCSAVFAGISKYDGMITSAYDVFRVNEKYLDNYYVDFWCQYVFSNRYYKIYSKNIRYTITRDIFNGIKTPVPPIEIQKKISVSLINKSEQLGKLIEIQQEQIEKLKEYKQSVITEAVTKGLNPTAPMKGSCIEWIGEIPAHWGVNRLKFCASYNDEVLKENENADKTIRYVEIGSVSLENGVETIEEFEFANAPSRARRITKKGDIIISTVRTYLKAIAYIKEDNLIVSTGFCVVRPNGKIANKYMEYFCKCNLFTDNVSACSYGISYPAINAPVLMAFSLPEPSIDEQYKIAEYLDKKCADIDKLIVLKQQKIYKLNEYKKSLIYEYITGKKEVI